MGPHDDMFLEESIILFLETDWVFSQNSDRMGCRFNGPVLKFKPRAAHLAEQAGADPSNIIDCPQIPGAIQNPSGKELAVWHVDGSAMGGYIIIATIISSDLWMLGQMMPGEKVRFRSVLQRNGAGMLKNFERDVSEKNIERRSD